MTPQFPFRSTLFLAFGLVAACGAYTQAPARGPDVLEVPISPRTASVKALGRVDIAPYEGRSLADALAHLRPDWLRLNPSGRVNAEGERAVLYVDDVASGDVAKLQLIASQRVGEARLLSASEAWARYGPSCRCPAGAIVVRTRSNE